MRKKIIAGNWKLHNTCSESLRLVNALTVKTVNIQKTEIIVCPAFTTLHSVSERLKDSRIKLGAQNVFWEKSGAYTGEISAEMLLDVGCEYVIIGHSERRQYFVETDATVNQRVKSALDAGLRVIVCVGETLEEREAEKTFHVIGQQLAGAFVHVDDTDPDKVIIAYEPVWAIGTGKTATPEQAQEVHRFIRDELAKQYDESWAEKIIIQYGGSVKPSNAHSLLSKPDIDGALVGGASLKADDFTGIIQAAEAIN